MYDYCFVQTAKFMPYCYLKNIGLDTIYDTVYERNGIKYFWSIKNSNEVLNKFIYKNFKASILSTYDFSTLSTTLPHHLIKDNLLI